jgi:hypothetical protein
MRRGINPDKTRVIPAPPQWQAPQSGLSLTALTTDEADAGVDFAWGPVPKATSYRFELATDRTMVRVIDRVTTAEARYRPARPIAPGRYWAHVRAVGDAGIVGAWSTALSVSILRYRLPPGAFVSADGTVVLPEGAGVVVPNGDCCEMAYENTSSLSERLAVPLYWSSVVGPLHLSEDAPMRVVHLRDRATMAEGRLVLAHRALRADVALGPPSARWPIDPIDAHIEIKDPSGRIDVTTEAVDVETTLDLTPLSVAWERRGATWAGRIAPRRIADPSVVRVVVRDALGSEIGRGFLELEPVPTAP